MRDVVSIIQKHSTFLGSILIKFFYSGLYIQNSEGSVSLKFRWVQLTV